MATISNKIIDTYNYLNTDLADPRTNNFFLISSPVTIVALTALYLYICKSLGPRYMKDKPPYSLKNVMFVYNLFQVFMNAYLFSEGAWYMSTDKYSFNCEPIDYSYTPRGLRLSRAAWWFFFSKVIDFLDTIFFVLRKKNNQVTFLHVYHHSIMALTMWIGVKYFPGGQGLVLGTLNSFVHIVMYTYYLISGLGPEYQKYVWWKKHLTVLQLVQFVVILIHALNGLFNGCNFPKVVSAVLAINALIFINLFGRFFYKSYINSDNKKGSAKNGTANNKSATNGTSTNGTAKNGTAKNGTAKNGTATIGTAKNGVENIISNGKHKED